MILIRAVMAFKMFQAENDSEDILPAKLESHKDDSPSDFSTVRTSICSRRTSTPLVVRLNGSISICPFKAQRASSQCELADSM